MRDSLGAVAGVALLVGVAYAAGSRVLLAGFERLEQAEVRENVSRARHALADQVEHLDAGAAPWSQWSDACDFANARDPRATGFIEAELNAGTVAALGANALVYARRDGRVAFATGYDLGASRLAPPPAGLAQVLAENPRLLSHLNARSRHSGVLLLPQGPMLFASRPLVRSEAVGGAVQGAVFVARFVGADTEASLSRHVEMPVQVRRADGREPARNFRLAREALLRDPRPAMVSQIGEETLAGYALIPGWDGAPALLARVAMPRRAMAQARESLKYLLASLCGIGALAAALLVGAQGRLAAQRARGGEESARFASVFDGMGEGLIITDLHDRVLNINRRMEEMCGYTLDEMRGRPAYEFLLPRDQWPNAGGRNERRAAGHSDAYEAQLQRRDGTRFWALIHATPLRDASGTVVGTIGAQVDISERKAAEEQHRAAQARFRALIDQAVDAIIVHDLQGRVVEVNRRFCESLGYSPEQARELDVRDFEANFEREAIQAQWDAMTPGCVATVDGVHRRRDGSTFPVEVRLGLVEWDGEKVVLALARDISERRAAEDRLRESEAARGASEERLRGLVTNAPMIFFSVDIRGVFTFSDGRGLDLLGLRPGEMVGRSAFEMYGASPEVGEMLCHALGGEPVVAEASVAGRLWQTRFSPLRRADGQIEGAIGVSIDITEQRAGEERWKESEARFRSVVESASDAIVLADGAGRIVSWNRGAQAMFGYSEEEALGECVTLFLPERFHPARLAGLAPVSEGGEHRLAGRPLDLVARGKDGAEFPVELTLNAWRAGGEAFYASIIRDTSERARMEADLRAALDERRRVMEAVPDILFTLDLQGRLVGWNPRMETFSGYAPHELQNRPALEFFRPEHHVTVADGIARSYEENGSSIEAPLLHADGHEIPVAWSSAPVRDAEGNLTGVTGVGRDMTERLEAEARTRASLREKEVLLKEIHHRVKNNLQIISSLLSLQSDLLEEPRARDAFNDSRSRVRSMALIHEKLYGSNDLARVDFADYLQVLASGLSRSYVSGGRVGLHVEADEVFLDIDTAAPLGLIVNELVTNALKYAFPDARAGTIRVELARREDALCLCVSDDGVGMPALDPEEVDSIGLQLVTGLTMQIEGEYELLRGNGTRWEITFRPGHQ